MNWFRKEEGRNNSEYLLEGFLQGMGVTLIGGPIFIVGLVKGWVSVLILVALCALVYLGAKKFIANKQLLTGVGRSEFWWLGFFGGFAVVMLLFFPVLGAPNA